MTQGWGTYWKTVFALPNFVDRIHQLPVAQWVGHSPLTPEIRVLSPTLTDEEDEDQADDQDQESDEDYDDNEALEDDNN